MTETVERIATLEANQVGLLRLAEKWDQMLVQVTEINSNLKNSFSQFETYRKTCEAELDAHAQRLGTAENAIQAIERHIAKGNTVWWVIVKIAAFTGGLAGFAATVMSMRHG